MAIIKLSAWQKYGIGGPEIPGEYGLCLGEKTWPGGGTVPILRFFFGQDEVEVWPADACAVRNLAEKLLQIVDQLENKEKETALLCKKWSNPCL